MKKSILLLVAAAALVSCSNDGSIAPAQREQMEMTVNVGIGTRATYDSDRKATWEAGDAIAVVQSCYGAAKSTLTMEGSSSNASGSATAQFKGNVTYIANTTQYYNYGYPVDNLTFSDGKTTYTHTIEATQSDLDWKPALYVSSSEKLDPEDAKAQSISFGAAKNALLSVRILSDKTVGSEQYKTNIASIVISPDEKGLNGTIVNTAAAYGNFTTEVVTSGETKAITANFTNAYEPMGGKEFRIDVLPVEAGIVTVTITDNQGTVKTIKSTKSVTFAAGALTTATVDWTAQTIEFTVDASFSDATDGGDILN